MSLIARTELEPVRRRQDEPAPWTVWIDGEGYSVEDRKGNRRAYFGMDCSGEGDYQQWNLEARRWAFMLADALNAEEWKRSALSAEE